MSRTYYELQDYHLQMIKDSGYKVGDEVYFPDVRNVCVRKGTIKGFDVHVEGDILVKCDWTRHEEYKDSALWNTDTDNVVRNNFTYTKEVFFDTIARDFETAKETLLSIFKDKVSFAKSELKSLKEKKERWNCKMGITNQAEIEKQQRHAAYVQVYFDLMKTKDKLGVPAFKNDNGDSLQVAMKINQLMEQVNHLINLR